MRHDKVSVPTLVFNSYPLLHSNLQSEPVGMFWNFLEQIAGDIKPWYGASNTGQNNSESEEEISLKNM